jgi:ATP-dependent RNA helicase RhlE
MNDFEILNLSNQLYRAVEELGFDKPTPIQEKACPVVLSGKDVVGIAQTGTGKTFAYLLPILRDLKYSKQVNPRVLIMVPTRELVIQVVEQAKSLSKYLNVRTLGVYGGVNINTQMFAVAEGMDILVATPGRLYDLLVNRAIILKNVKKLVIDEVDVMLDLGFRFQLTNIFDFLPERRQNIMFSATMTEEVDALIDDFFIAPVKVSVAISGTPLDNIAQQCYPVRNFFTKVNLLSHLLNDKELYQKVLVFVSHKKNADKLFEALEEQFGEETGIIHSNKSQNNRIRTVNKFDKGVTRILIATDVIARGIDLEMVTHVINFDTPGFPENYMHRIGRTGRAEQEGKSILFYTPAEEEAMQAIEDLMDYKIPQIEFPAEVEVSRELIAEERPIEITKNPNRNTKSQLSGGGAFHEKKDKNKKTNQGGSYLRKRKTYKKPKTKGDKIFNRRNKRK